MTEVRNWSVHREYGFQRDKVQARLVAWEPRDLEDAVREEALRKEKAGAPSWLPAPKPSIGYSYKNGRPDKKQGRVEHLKVVDSIVTKWRVAGQTFYIDCEDGATYKCAFAHAAANRHFNDGQKPNFQAIKEILSVGVSNGSK